VLRKVHSTSRSRPLPVTPSTYTTMTGTGYFLPRTFRDGNKTVTSELPTTTVVRPATSSPGDHESRRCSCPGPSRRYSHSSSGRFEPQGAEQYADRLARGGAGRTYSCGSAGQFGWSRHPPVDQQQGHRPRLQYQQQQQQQQPVLVVGENNSASSASTPSAAGWGAAGAPGARAAASWPAAQALSSTVGHALHPSSRRSSSTSPVTPRWVTSAAVSAGGPLGEPPAPAGLYASPAQAVLQSHEASQDPSPGWQCTGAASSSPQLPGVLWGPAFAPGSSSSSSSSRGVSPAVRQWTSAAPTSGGNAAVMLQQLQAWSSAPAAAAAATPERQWSAGQHELVLDATAGATTGNSSTLASPFDAMSMAGAFCAAGSTVATMDICLLRQPVQLQLPQQQQLQVLVLPQQQQQQVRVLPQQQPQQQQQLQQPQQVLVLAQQPSAPLPTPLSGRLSGPLPRSLSGSLLLPCSYTNEGMLLPTVVPGPVGATGNSATALPSVAQTPGAGFGRPAGSSPAVGLAWRPASAANPSYHCALEVPESACGSSTGLGTVMQLSSSYGAPSGTLPGAVRHSLGLEAMGLGASSSTPLGSVRRLSSSYATSSNTLPVVGSPAAAAAGYATAAAAGYDGSGEGLPAVGGIDNTLAAAAAHEKLAMLQQVEDAQRTLMEGVLALLPLIFDD
jgi:hypothetical protein